MTAKESTGALLVRDKAASSTEMEMDEGGYPGRSRERSISSRLSWISASSTEPEGVIMKRAGPEEGMKGRGP